MYIGTTIVIGFKVALVDTLVLSRRAVVHKICQKTVLSFDKNTWTKMLCQDTSGALDQSATPTSLTYFIVLDGKKFRYDLYAVQKYLFF
jgi:hypothetical protein